MRGYPDVRIDNLVSGYSASGRTSYAWCASGDFNIASGDSYVESRGLCLLSGIEAIMKNGTHNIRAQGYRSSGTAYSQFEIVAMGIDHFKVRRVGTSN